MIIYILSIGRFTPRSNGYSARHGGSTDGPTILKNTFFNRRYDLGSEGKVHLPWP